MTETERKPDFREKVWNRLSQATQEVCEVFGAVPFGKDELEEIAEDPASVFDELSDYGLIETLNRRQILEENAIKISDERLESTVSQEGPTPPLTDEEKSSLRAIHSLREYQNNSSLFPDFDELNIYRFTSELNSFLTEKEENK